MIAGAKKYDTDNPGVIDLTTLACKTNDDTPCQIAQIQDSVTKGSKAIVIANMGPGVMPALNAAKAAGVKIILVDNNLPGFDAGRHFGDRQRQGRHRGRRLHQDPAQVR